MDDFFELRNNLYKSHQGNVPPFALLPYSNTQAKAKDKKFPFSSQGKMKGQRGTNTGDLANAEAPFLREIRVALDTWLDTLVLDQNLQASNRLVFLLFYKYIYITFKSTNK